MDVITITCPHCGCTEGYPHPESVRERKECIGCVAKQLIQNGLAYWASELMRQQKREDVEATQWNWSRVDDPDLSDRLSKRLGARSRETAK